MTLYKYKLEIEEADRKEKADDRKSCIYNFVLMPIGFIAIFFAGSFLIEKTFGIDGIGLLGYNALIERDYDIIMGSLAFGTIIGQIGNLISDIAYAIVDPRIRFK